jgi:hypothetical protein
MYPCSKSPWHFEHLTWWSSSIFVLASASVLAMVMCLASAVIAATTSKLQTVCVQDFKILFPLCIFVAAPWQSLASPSNLKFCTEISDHAIEQNYDGIIKQR